MSVTHTAVTPQVSDGAQVGPCGEGDGGIRDVLDRIGDKWTVLVIVELAKGVRRFRELQRTIPGISQRMLTLTTRRLCRDGLVGRTMHPTIPPRVEYRLTPMGSSLAKAVFGLADWAATHKDEMATSRQRWDAAHADETGADQLD